MSYLVDGNNLMAQRVGWHKNKAQARRGLMDELADFAQSRQVVVTVVFDGAPEDHFGDGARYRGITVCYARTGSDADSRSKEMIETARQRRTWRVVTSDRALGDYVRRCGAQLLRCQEFRRLMSDAAPRPVPTTIKEKPPRLSSDELARELRYFGCTLDD